MATASLSRLRLDDALQAWPPQQDCIVYQNASGDRFEIDGCHSYTTSELDWFGVPLRFRFEEHFVASDPEYSFIVTNNATVVGDTGVVLNASGNLVLESLFPHDRSRPFEKVLEIPEFASIDGSVVVDEDVFLLFRGGGFKNFWHFHVDMLPTIVFMQENSLLGRAKIAVPKMSAWHREAIERLGVSPEHLFEVDGRYCKFRRAYLFSTIFNPDLTIPNALARRTFDRLKAKAAPDVNESSYSNRPRMIYVSRIDSAARMMANEQTLVDVLRDIGFEILIPSKMTYQAQQEAFASAAVIVGPHGAGMTNICVANKNALVVEIFPFGVLNAPHYHFLAKCLSLKYEMFVSKVRSPVSPHEHWTINVDAFLFRLSCLMHKHRIVGREKFMSLIPKSVPSAPTKFPGNLDVRFGSGNQIEYFKRFGFSGLEDWGCWMCESEGAVRFDFGLPKRFRLSGKIEVFEPALSRPLAFQCGISRHELTKKAKAIDFVFDNPDQDQTIWIEAPGAVSPAQTSANPFADPRSLSIAIKGLKITEL